MVFSVFQVLFLTASWAFDPDIVWQWPECKGQKSQWSTADIQYLKERNLFFNPVDPLNRFSVGVDKLNEFNKPETLCSKTPRKSPFRGMNKEPHQAAILVDQIQRKMTAQMKKDLNTQENLIQNGIVCTEENVPAKIKANCDAYLNELMPQLQERLQVMRAVKSLAQNDAKPQHDKPFTTGLYSQFFPTLWKKDTIKELSPLTEGERKIRSELVEKKVMPDDAEKAYYSLLSTTPILLFFDKEINKQNLNEALKKLKAQNHFDQKENLETPRQELFMMPEYVKQAITDLPDSQRGDACKVVSEIYKNLKIQYETAPNFLMVVGGVASLTSAPVKILGKKILAGVSSKMIATGTAGVGMNSYQNFLKYRRGVEFCSTQFFTDKALESKVCHFEGLNKVYISGQDRAVGAVGGGMATFALLRVVFNNAKVVFRK